VRAKRVLVEEMDSIFKPKSIAIVGASADSKKIGNRILRNLLSIGFLGKLYLVNPQAPNILGFKAFPTVASISGEVDLAVIVVPASAVLEAMKDCVQKGVKGAVVITSGFAETGPQGRELQEKMVQIARSGGLRFVGPNCEGIFNATTKIDLTFSPKSPRKGGISFISQSGAIGANTMFRWGNERGVGFNIFCSSGNEADLCSPDYLEYAGEDGGTKVIMMYIEGIRNGRRLLEVAKKVTQNKPIVIMKGGETETGSRAVSSHTGSISGSDTIFRTVCAQTGMIKVEDVDELFDITMTFDCQPVPKSNRVGIVTGAGGGLGVVAVDACVKLGLDVPTYSENTRAELRSLLPHYAAVNNPVDLTPIFDPMRLVKCTETVLRDERIDSVISMGFGWRTDLVSVELAAVDEFLKLKQFEKPLVVVSVSSKCEFETLRKLESGGIPVFLTPSKASRAIAALLKRRRYLEKKGKSPGAH
jgi:acetyl coenzyme A synthetase (ADP forming)-like protein